MKNFFLTAVILFIAVQMSYAQETEQIIDSVAVAQQLEKQKQELEEAKRIQKQVDKAEKAQKKAEKAQKKADKAIKKQEKLKKAIASRKKAIRKSEMKIQKLQNKLAKGMSKGKISPAKEIDINQEITKLESNIVKYKAKLAKLEKK